MYTRVYGKDIQYTHPHLHYSSLEHATHDEHGVRRPLDVLHGVKTGVQVQNLKSFHVPDHQAVLGAAGHVPAIGRELDQVLGLLKCL